MTLSNEPFEALKEARRYLSQLEVAALLKRDPRTIRRWEEGTIAPDPLIVPALRAELESERAVNGGTGNGRANSKFTFIDLFAGIGGMRKGFEAHGGQCVYTSEWDKYAAITYKANFPDGHEIYGDITQAATKDAIPAHDVLVAGFPCQPFSLAGVSKKNSLGRKHGFLDETQGTLFFDICKILEMHQPRAFLLENVKNLQSHDKGQTFRIIRKALDDLGYKISFRTIDARHWVPQHRERIFIVGFKETKDYDLKKRYFPEEKDVWKARHQTPLLGDILHSKDEVAEDPFTIKKGNKTEVAPKYILTDHLWQYLQDYAEKHRLAGNGFGCTVVSSKDVTRTLSARYHKDGSEILVSRGKGKVPRRLTPRECARLMGFDEKRGSKFKITVSDTQAYRQFGNSVAVPVIKAVAGDIAKIVTAELALKKSIPLR
jgi:DNA (cytosine-5)-methyltransferase 1